MDDKTKAGQDFENEIERLKGEIVLLRSLQYGNAVGRKEEIHARDNVLLCQILDYSPFPVVLTDVFCEKIEYWNCNAMTLFGHLAPTSSEWFRLAYPDPEYRREVIVRWTSHLEEARSSGRTVNTGEYRISCADGSTRLCEIYATYIPEGLIATFVDVTARKAAEEALVGSEEKFRNFFMNSPLGKSITGLDGSLFMNEEFCKILGYSEEELRGLKLMDITHPEDTALTAEIMQTLMEGKASRSRFEKRYIHKSGRTIWVDVSTYLQRDKDGNPEFFITNIQDITERKHSEDLVRSLSSRNEAILDSVPDIIMEVDNNKVYTWANRSGIQFFGEDVIGKEAAHYFEGEQDTYNIVKPLFNGETTGVIYVESWQRRCDGEKRLLAWWCRVLHDASGKVTGTLSAAQDITELRQAEEQVRILNDRLQELIRAGKELSSARNKETIQAIVVSSAGKLTGAEGVTLVYRDNDQCFYAVEEAIGPLWKGERFPVNSCISGWVMLNKVPAIIPDVFTDERTPQDLYRSTFVKSLAMVPVRSGDPVAAIGCYWKSYHQASEMEVQLLQTLADLASRAMENVMLYEELETKVKEKTTELQERVDELERFYEATIDRELRMMELNGEIEKLKGLKDPGS